MAVTLHGGHAATVRQCDSATVWHCDTATRRRRSVRTLVRMSVGSFIASFEDVSSLDARFSDTLSVAERTVGTTETPAFVGRLGALHHRPSAHEMFVNN